jgi:AcrR family transcriptional regulator
MARRRLTRQEQQTETRERLLQAAAKVFARHGFDGASLAQVADEAGYTKGAVYSNFASKDELFAALLESHCQRSLEETRRLLLSPGPAEDRLQRIGDRLVEQILADRDWTRLFIEFWAQSLRDAKLRRRFLAAWGAAREGLTELIANSSRDAGVALPLPADQLASATMALTNGLALQILLAPELVDPSALGVVLTKLVPVAARPARAVGRGNGDGPSGGRAAAGGADRTAAADRILAASRGRKPSSRAGGGAG